MLLEVLMKMFMMTTLEWGGVYRGNSVADPLSELYPAAAFFSLFLIFDICLRML
jgi:hypothetical protein